MSSAVNGNATENDFVNCLFFLSRNLKQIVNDNYDIFSTVPNFSEGGMFPRIF